ncbi:hypothetical protein CSC74_08165 [Pseudoxanthomonas yeongjuensis]|uniref:XVIPCD domain-containing protein n=1 Tax=Pseudoxanthomonas yeongjuensis TaxID=377616 RepID=UPI001FE6F950|nr:XVIPCD domain-containing protein [Pseudoxanthomonas yeongjuensis]KAF1716840.1 hypothetical protein CSC74_08165 [Pseudoxanthomonas yeongjuensis]
MDPQDKHYTVTIYVAAPGTPLTISKGTSDAGHVYYSVDDGQMVDSYGFAPAKHGESSGPGKVYEHDVTDYKDPYYSRTLEITKAQYDKLREFGGKPDEHGFDMEYRGAVNSCIDYTWGALNHAGLHRHTLLGKDKDYDGALKPLDNVRDIKSIEAPFPKSELNQERQNKMPERTPLQWLISEQEQAAPEGPARGHASTGPRDPLIPQAEAAVRRLDAHQYDDQSACMAASAACLAKANGLSRIDHIFLSEARGSTQKGENLFVVQGAPGDPAHLRAQMKTQDAIDMPVEKSLGQLQALNEMPQPQQSLQMDEAIRQTGPQVRMS